MSGGRIKRLAPYLGDEPFMLTWCDGLADVDLDRLRAFHERHGRLGDADRGPSAGALRPARPSPATGSPPSRRRSIDPDEWINGAFFVLDPGVFDYIAGDDTQFEHEPLSALAADGELMAYRHESFWQCMDTLKEAQDLNALWRDGRGALESLGIAETTMRVLLTGNEGYIGTILVPWLWARGHEVVGLDSGLFRECTLRAAIRAGADASARTSATSRRAISTASRR